MEAFDTNGVNHTSAVPVYDQGPLELGFRAASVNGDMYQTP